jgi:hypothetical protein
MTVKRSGYLEEEDEILPLDEEIGCRKTGIIDFC